MVKSRRACHVTLILGLLSGCSTFKEDPKVEGLIRHDTAGGVPIYGNWCGPNHPQDIDTNIPSPIDFVDAICMRHDYCYAERGYANCSCDIRAWSRLHVRPEPVAKVIADYFGSSPCWGWDLMLKPTTTATDALEGAMGKYENGLGFAITLPFAIAWGIGGLPIWMVTGLPSNVENKLDDQVDARLAMLGSPYRVSQPH